MGLRDAGGGDDPEGARPMTGRTGRLGWPMFIFLLGPATGAVAKQHSAVREIVLKQIQLPHHYYYREMYLPQATTGPGSVAWSPDGTEVVYSMQGSLWRQRLGTTVALQITNGPGYDYQPDWSPDGRFIAYASYRDDAVELRLLEIQGGQTRSITKNGAVNVEPRFSPEGRRLLFVSTVYNRRFHIHSIALDEKGNPGEIARLTADHDSGLPRYYYSPYDHYISPAWSPDGKEILFVSNRGHIWGTGGFFRMKAEPGSEMREIHYEETTWKGRPDWSPDGRRIVYASYLGGQWHQLWLMTDEGGDVFPLTYGEFDAVAPRWSRDGGRIAFISNQDGDTSLWIIEVPGGKRVRVEAKEKRYLGPVGRPRLTVVDRRTSRIVPARVSVTGPDGRSFAPDDSWRHSDEAFDRGERKFEYSYFHTPGTSEVTVPAGPVTVEATRGLEYGVFSRQVAVPARGLGTGQIVLGPNGHFLLPPYAAYVTTAASSLYPNNPAIFDMAHRQGAITGYVHPFDTDPDPAKMEEPLTHDLPVGAALKKIDYLEVVGFSDHLATSGVWFRLLNCGLRIPAGAGTDAMADYASLRGPVGVDRVYVRTGARPDHARFLAGIRAGRTFATNGPLLLFTLAGKAPGDEIRLPAGGGTLQARVTLASIVPADHLEIRANGKVVADLPLSGDRRSLTVSHTLPVATSGWYVLRAYADRPEHPVLDTYPFGATSPIYVVVGGQAVRSSDDAAYFLAWLDRLEKATREHKGWNTPVEMESVLGDIASARAVYLEQAGP